VLRIAHHQGRATMSSPATLPSVEDLDDVAGSVISTASSNAQVSPVSISARASGLDEITVALGRIMSSLEDVANRCRDLGMDPMAVMRMMSGGIAQRRRVDHA
jgi:hypothetical protein